MEYEFIAQQTNTTDYFINDIHLIWIKSCYLTLPVKLWE